jgi:hypothetical protein
VKLPEETTHSFIVRVWLESAADEGSRAGWRGQVTHVPDGKGRYVRNLDAVPAFIAPYLAAMGVRLGLRWRITSCLSRRM